MSQVITGITADLTLASMVIISILGYFLMVSDLIRYWKKKKYHVFPTDFNVVA